MFRNLSKYQDTGILIARIGVGLSFIIVHGLKKLIGGTEKWESYGNAMKNLGIEFFPVFWGFMAAVSETIGGVLIIIGLFLRPAALFIFLTMCVAALRHYSNGDALSKIAYPVEMAMIMILFLFIGAGKYSIDNKLWRKG